MLASYATIGELYESDVPTEKKKKSAFSRFFEAQSDSLGTKSA